MKKENKLLLPRPLSWSGMNLLEKDEKRWIRKYLNGEKVDFNNSGIRFGKKVAEHLESDEETEDLALESIKNRLVRYGPKETGIKAVLKCEHGEIPLTGSMDTCKPDFTAFREVKTGRGQKAWDQEKAQNHGQNHFYATLIHINTGVIPECHLDWLQTEEIDGVVQFTGGLLSFPVKFTLLDIIKMRRRIIKNALRIDYLVRESMKDL